MQMKIEEQWTVIATPKVTYSRNGPNNSLTSPKSEVIEVLPDSEGS